MVSSQAGSLSELGTPRDRRPHVFIFTSDLDDGIESTLNKFAGDTTWSGQMNTSEGKIILQKHLDRLEE